MVLVENKQTKKHWTSRSQSLFLFGFYIFFSTFVPESKLFYYINTNEIPGELSRENMISSHVKRSRLLWLHDTSRLSQQQNVKVKWFGISLVFI